MSFPNLFLIACFPFPQVTCSLGCFEELSKSQFPGNGRLNSDVNLTVGTFPLDHLLAIHLPLELKVIEVIMYSFPDIDFD